MIASSGSSPQPNVYMLACNLSLVVGCYLVPSTAVSWPVPTRQMSYGFCGAERGHAVSGSPPRDLCCPCCLKYFPSAASLEYVFHRHQRHQTSCADRAAAMCVDQVMFVSGARGGIRVNRERWREKAGQGRLFAWAKRCRTHAGQYSSSVAMSPFCAGDRAITGSGQRAVPAMRSRRACMQPAH